MSTDPQIVELRQKFLDSAKSDSVKADFRTLFSDDFCLWLRLTGWTYAPKEVDERTGREVPSAKPHRPYVLWPCQERAAVEILEAVGGGRDVVMRKSRDMGASWLLAAVSAWGWLFKGWQTLLVSRVEDGVDRPGDPDSLFWKVDYLLETQPPWLLPGDAVGVVEARVGYEAAHDVAEPGIWGDDRRTGEYGARGSWWTPDDGVVRRVCGDG